MSRLDDAIRAKFGDATGLGGYYERMFLFIEPRIPALAEALVRRIEQAPRSEAKVREVLAEMIAAYDNVSKGARVYPEPAINAEGTLQLRPARQGEKRSDLAVTPPWAAARTVNLEAKTPLPDDRREASNFGKFDDDFRYRVKRLWKNGLRPQSVAFEGRPALLTLKGRDIAGAMTSVERAVRQLTESTTVPGSHRFVAYLGNPIARVHLLPGQGLIGTGKGMGAPPFDAEGIVDRGQLATDAPNVVLINLAGALLPLPELVLKGFQDAFGRGRLAVVSAVLVYMADRGRDLLLNETAKIPLNQGEVEYFQRPHPPP